MATKILLSAILCILGLASCGLADNGQCNTNRSFVIDWSVGGVIDTIKVGDTIKLQMKLPNQIVDLNSGELVDVEGWALDPLLQVLGVKEDMFVGKDPSFDYYSTLGGLTARETADSSWTILLKLTPEDDSKRFSGGMVTLEAGKYHISTGNFLKSLVLEECPNRLVWLDYNLVDENGDSRNNNYHMLESEALREEFTEEEMEQFAGFVFVVEP